MIFEILLLSLQNIQTTNTLYYKKELKTNTYGTTDSRNPRSLWC